MSTSISRRSFVDRYFARRYIVDVMNRSNEDHCLLVHSNGVCVLTLAQSHPVVQSGLIVKSVDYKVTEKVDRMENKVSGKSKRGAQNLAPESPVCRIICGEKGDLIYTVRACVKGRLIEVNERLISEPQLLVAHPETLGYVCVIVQKKSVQREGQTADQEQPSGGFSSMDKKSFLRLRYPDSGDFDEMNIPCKLEAAPDDTDS